MDKSANTTAAGEPTSSEWMVRGIAATGAATGLGALAGASCCLVPTLIGWLGLGAGAISLTLLGAVEFLSPWRHHLLLASAALVFAGWALWLRQRRAACGFAPLPNVSRMSRATRAMLIIATVCLVGAIGWEYVELLLMETRPV